MEFKKEEFFAYLKTVSLNFIKKHFGIIFVILSVIIAYNYFTSSPKRLSFEDQVALQMPAPTENELSKQKLNSYGIPVDREQYILKNKMLWHLLNDPKTPMESKVITNAFLLFEKAIWTKARNLENSVILDKVFLFELKLKQCFNHEFPDQAQIALELVDDSRMDAYPSTYELKRASQYSNFEVTDKLDLVYEECFGILRADPKTIRWE